MSVLSRIPATSSSAGSTKHIPVDTMTMDTDFVEAIFVPDAPISSPASPIQLQINYLRNGIVVPGGSLASVTISAGWPAQKPLTFTVNAAAPSLTMGDAIELAIVQGASGAALPPGLLRITTAGRYSTLADTPRTEWRMDAISSSASATTLLTLHVARSLGQLLCFVVFVPDALFKPTVETMLYINRYRNGGVQVDGDGGLAGLCLLPGMSFEPGQPLPFEMQPFRYLIPGDVVALKYVQGDVGQAIPAGLIHAMTTADWSEIPSEYERNSNVDAIGSVLP